MHVIVWCDPVSLVSVACFVFVLKKIFGFCILLDALLGETSANLFTTDSISQHGSWNARVYRECPSWSPSPRRTAASAAEDPVEKKRCGSESDFCPPAAVCLLLSCPVRRSQQLPALVRMWWTFSVAISGSFWCLTLFHWSCSPVPGVRGSSRWPRAQL